MTIWLYSDPHFGHAGVCKFLRADGTPLRPWNDPAEMDEALVEKFNERVKPKDKCYILGDVVINRKALATVRRLNGDKVLIKGNHDIFNLKDYLDVGFRDIRAYHVMNGMIMSHIPVHEGQLARFGTNIHGHLHSNRVMKSVPELQVDAPQPRTYKIREGIDSRYHCVCVEHTDFAPISFEDVQARIIQEGGSIGFNSGNK